MWHLRRVESKRGRKDVHEPIASRTESKSESERRDTAVNLPHLCALVFLCIKKHLSSDNRSTNKPKQLLLCHKLVGVEGRQK